jgi:cation:H+ antiporter
MISVINKDGGLAIGNIIGANIFNASLVFAVGILIGKLKIGTSKTQRNALIVVLMTLIFITLQKFSTLHIIPNIVLGSILIVLAILFTVVQYRWGVIGRTNEDKQYVDSSKQTKKFNVLVTLKLLTVLTGICVGGLLLVDAVESISLATGYSTTILGLTLTALVTTFPELLTTITSQRDKEEKITTGNIIGSNVYNLLLIGGLITITSDSSTISLKETFFLVLVTVFFALIIRIYSGKVIPKWIGFILIGVFLTYIYFMSLK